METGTNRHCWLLVLSLGGSCLLGCRDRVVTADKDVQRQEVTPVPRPVSHWAYFPSADKRAEFVSRVVPKGFKITNEHRSDDRDAKYPYGVTLERTDRVDQDSIDEVTLDLLDLAQDLGGEYDGWETTVEEGT